MPVIANQKDAAKEIGISARWLREWAKIPGFPKRADKQYDTDAIKAWHHGRQRQAELDAEAKEAREIRRQDDIESLRTKRLTNEDKELKLALKRGSLHPKEVTTELLMLICTEIRDGIATLQKAGNVNAATTIEESLKSAQSKIQRRLSELGAV